MEWGSLERIVIEMIALAALSYLPTKRLGEIIRGLRLLRADVHDLADELSRHRKLTSRRFRSHRRRLDGHDRRLDAHDQAAGIDTREETKEGP